MDHLMTHGSSVAAEPPPCEDQKHDGDENAKCQKNAADQVSGRRSVLFDDGSRKRTKSCPRHYGQHKAWSEKHQALTDRRRLRPPTSRIPTALIVTDRRST